MSDELTPESRRIKADPAGVPIELADGMVWKLAPGGLIRALDGLRDELFDGSQLAGQVPVVDLRWVAWSLLLVNYRLDNEELWLLTQGVPTATLADAVTAALYGPERPRRTYSTWARASLWANGIDPDKVPAEDIPDLLHFLVKAGRTVPLSEYSEAAEAAATFEEARAMARQYAAAGNGIARSADPGS